MRHDKGKQLAALFLGLLMMVSFGTLTFAETDNSTVGYDVQAVLPDNQITKENTFFDLRMKPSDKQTITIQVNNTSDEEGTYELSVNQAYTNAQGFIDYDRSMSQVTDKDYDMTKIANIQDTVTIPSHSSQEVPIELTMPKDAYDGQLLAGIQVTKAETNQAEGHIGNSYGYVIGLKLTETDTEVTRDLILEKVEPAVSFGRTSVVAYLKNPTRDAYGHLVYKGTVTDKGTNKVVKEVSYDNDMQLAPMSSYGFAIDWENERLKAGEYALHLTVSDAKDNEWTFDETFKITEKEAKEMNALTVDQGSHQSLPMWVYIVIGALLALVLLVIIWFILLKKKQKEQEDKKASKTKKKSKKKK